MAIRENSTFVLEKAVEPGREPPFLQESTVVVDQEPVREFTDRFVDFIYRWRLLLAFSLAPVLLAAFALSFDGEGLDDPVLTGRDGDGSQLGALVQGVTGDETRSDDVSPDDGQAGAGTATAVPSTTEQEEAAGRPTTDSSSTNALPTLANTTPSSTAAPTTSAPTTTAPPTTTTPPTTAPPTTSPPTTPVTTPVEACIVSIRKKTNMRAEPDKDSEKVGSVKRGEYPVSGVSEDGTWLLINANGTTGWISSRAVNGVRGDC